MDLPPVDDLIDWKKWGKQVNGLVDFLVRPHNLTTGLPLVDGLIDWEHEEGIYESIWEKWGNLINGLVNLWCVLIT